MSEMQKQTKATIIEQVLITGNLASLTPEQRVEYYNAVCASTGLNPLTRPFDFIVLNGKLTLYARKDAADQLRKIHGVSIVIKEQKEVDGIYIVTANGKDRSGKEDEDVGAVNVAGLKGEMKANAIMKAITKAKRRVTLSVCGMGMLDETEVESIPGAEPFSEQAQAKTEAKTEAMKEKLIPKKEKPIEVKAEPVAVEAAPVEEKRLPPAEPVVDVPPPAPKPKAKEKDNLSEGKKLLQELEDAPDQDTLNAVIQKINLEIKPNGKFPLSKISIADAKAFKEEVVKIRDMKKLDFDSEKKVMGTDESF